MAKKKSGVVMRIVCISDTHNLHEKLSDVMPDGDCLVHAGDLTTSGTLRELASIGDWLQRQLDRYKHVVCTGGNHDFALEKFMQLGEEDLLRRNFFGDVIYLRDNAVAIGNRKFYGSPWSPKAAPDSDWAFQLPRGMFGMRDKASLIPDGTDVLITHCPPYGILDYWSSPQKRLGDEDLWERVDIVRPKLHVFGHIHTAYGERYDDRVPEQPTRFVNASALNIQHECYKYDGRKPIVVDIP